MKNEWRTVTRKHRCPICQKPDWCGVHENGELAICMRVMSDKESKNGGWIHILKEAVPNYKYIPPPKPKVTKEVDLDVDSMIAVWRSETTQEQINTLAAGLGVSQSAVRRLDAVWAPQYNAWAFPMRNDIDQITGIRLRNDSGQKWAVTGSHSGLFVPMGLESKTLLIVEGPTDTAAGLTLGYDTIGRPSCRGQEEIVVKWLRRRRYDEIVLLVDNDKPDPNTGKRPGIEGAKKLGIALKRPVKLVRTPFKDIRTWLACGLCKAELDGVISNTKAQIIIKE